jgi:ABC-type transport system substrate-binding protein
MVEKRTTDDVVELMPGNGVKYCSFSLKEKELEDEVNCKRPRNRRALNETINQSTIKIFFLSAFILL